MLRPGKGITPSAHAHAVAGHFPGRGGGEQVNGSYLCAQACGHAQGQAGADGEPEQMNRLTCGVLRDLLRQLLQVVLAVEFVRQVAHHHQQLDALRQGRLMQHRRFDRCTRHTMEIEQWAPFRTAI